MGEKIELALILVTLSTAVLFFGIYIGYKIGRLTLTGDDPCKDNCNEESE